MLTNAQLQTLKAWVIANNNSLFDQSAVDALNTIAAPAYWGLRTSLGKHELTQENGIDTDGVSQTGFVWGGAQGGYIARSQGERDAFKEIFDSDLACKPALPNVRTAFDDIFSGSGAGAVACRAHIKAMSRRKSSVFEKLYAIQTVGGPTQTGNRGATTNPDTLVVTETVTLQDVINSESA